MNVIRPQLNLNSILARYATRGIFACVLGATIAVSTLAQVPSEHRADNPSLPDEEISIARQSYDRKDYDQAIRLLDEFLTSHPDDVQALVLRGNAYTHRRDFKVAFQDFDHVLKADPNNIPALLGRADVHIATWDLKTAFDEQGRAIEIDPKSVDARVDHGHTARLLGMPKIAIADFTVAIVNESDVPDHWVRRGVAREEAGDDANAEQDFRAALRLGPDSAAALGGMGYLQISHKRYADAVAWLDKAIALDPSDPSLLDMRADAHMELGKFPDAFADRARMIESLPKNSLPLMLRAAAFFSVELYDLALKDMDAAIALDPEFVLYRYHRSEIFIYLNQLKKALADINLAIEEDLTCTPYYQVRAYIRNRLGDIDGFLQDRKIIKRYRRTLVPNNCPSIPPFLFWDIGHR